MKLRVVSLLAAALLGAHSAAWAAVPAVSSTPASAATDAAAHPLPPGIAWETGDINAAFAKARATNKPLFLYWGAVWCPPCNQVKSTIFNQQAFKERSSYFVPVYLDGDSALAQKLGEQFKVLGYPTMILFRPDGTEITRLPGEVDAARYIQALSLAMNATHPVKQSLALGLQEGAHLSQDDWRLLADYSWDTDDGVLAVTSDKNAVTLETLARHAQADHAPIEALRLELKAVAAAATNPHSAPIDHAAGLAAVQKVLADPALSRGNFDILVNYTAEITGYLTTAGTAERKTLASAFDHTLTTLDHDRSLSTTDRISALYGRVALAKLDTPKGAPLPAALLQTVRTEVAAADKATTNGYERQSVISNAGDTLTEAGLIPESDTLLTAELKRSPAPYYFMLGLAENAAARGDKAAALKWYQEAYDTSKGPATRLRWGVSYLRGVIDLTPQDDARVTQVASSVLTEAGAIPDAFYGRNRAALERLVTKLNGWNQDKQHDAAVHQVLTQLSDVCAKLPQSDPQHATCVALTQPTHS